MKNLTIFCYLTSLLFYALGYFKTLNITNAGELIAAYDITVYVSLAIGYFILAIIFAITGLFFFIKHFRHAFLIKDVELRVKRGRRLAETRRRVSRPELKAQLMSPEYNLDLYKRMSS